MAFTLLNCTRILVVSISIQLNIFSTTQSRIWYKDIEGYHEIMELLRVYFWKRDKEEIKSPAER